MNKYITGVVLTAISFLILASLTVSASPNVIISDNASNPSLQWLVNVLFTLVGILGGWILTNVQKALKDLQIADSALADKVHLIDVLVAGQYVKKDELEKLSFALFSKLDRIEGKLDNKADKE